VTGYDIIGDVHGYAEKLRGLLKQLGYRAGGSAYMHPDRQAIFVGDLIDRGPSQVESVEIVRSMVDAGAAQITMGNHEFNAIGYATPDPRTRGEYLRSRSGSKGVKHRSQHAEFLAEVGEDSELHKEYVGWFKALPLWLELSGLKIIHACWHDASIKSLAGLADGVAQSGEEFWVEASTKGTATYQAVDTILKGPEIDLGARFTFVDKDGHARSEARIRWWDGEAVTLRDIAEIPKDSQTPDHQTLPLLPEVRSDAAERYHYVDPEPVFFGHYWRTGQPTVEGPRTVCVDYSAGTKKGPLVAYRWDGESVPTNDKFVAFEG
jgi:hypothetical protein